MLRPSKPKRFRIVSSIMFVFKTRISQIILIIVTQVFLGIMRLPISQQVEQEILKQLYQEQFITTVELLTQNTIT